MTNADLPPPAPPPPGTVGPQGGAASLPPVPPPRPVPVRLRLAVASVAVLAALAVMASPLLPWVVTDLGPGREQVVRGVDLPDLGAGEYDDLIYTGDDPFVGTTLSPYSGTIQGGDLPPNDRSYGPATAAALGALLLLAGALAVLRCVSGPNAVLTGLVVAGMGVAAWSAAIAFTDTWVFELVGSGLGVWAWLLASLVAVAALGMTALLCTVRRPLRWWWGWAPLAWTGVVAAPLAAATGNMHWWATLWAPMAVSAVAIVLVMVGFSRAQAAARLASSSTQLQPGIQPGYPSAWLALALASVIPLGLIALVALGALISGV